MPRGAAKTRRARLRGEASEAEASTATITVLQDPHEVFSAQGQDLCTEIEVQLFEPDHEQWTHHLFCLLWTGRISSLGVGRVLARTRCSKVAVARACRSSEAKAIYLVVKVIFPEDGWLTDPAAVARLKELLSPGAPIERGRRRRCGGGLVVGRLWGWKVKDWEDDRRNAPMPNAMIVALEVWMLRSTLSHFSLE